MILIPFYELVSEKCHRNSDTLNLNEIVHAMEEGNTMSDVDDHHVSRANYKPRKDNQTEFLDSRGMEQRDT